METIKWYAIIIQESSKISCVVDYLLYNKYFFENEGRLVFITEEDISDLTQYLEQENIIYQIL